MYIPFYFCCLFTHQYTTAHSYYAQCKYLTDNLTFIMRHISVISWIVPPLPSFCAGQRLSSRSPLSPPSAASLPAGWGQPPACESAPSALCIALTEGESSRVSLHGYRVGQVALSWHFKEKNLEEEFELSWMACGRNCQNRTGAVVVSGTHTWSSSSWKSLPRRAFSCACFS